MELHLFICDILETECIVTDNDPYEGGCMHKLRSKLPPLPSESNGLRLSYHPLPSFYTHAIRSRNNGGGAASFLSYILRIPV